MPPPFSVDEVRQIREFEKIVKFRDAVVSGSHPRVKLPPHLIPSKLPARPVSSSALPTAAPGLGSLPGPSSGTGVQKTDNRLAFQANAHHPPVAPVACPDSALLPPSCCIDVKPPQAAWPGHEPKPTPSGPSCSVRDPVSRACSRRSWSSGDTSCRPTSMSSMFSRRRLLLWERPLQLRLPMPL